MSILIDIAKVLYLLLLRWVRVFMQVLAPIEPTQPMPMPRTKRPAPPKGQLPTEKYRLVPNTRGSYTLEEWDKVIEDYICLRVNVTPGEADNAINNLDRDTIYYREIKE